LWRVLRSREQFGRPDLPLLTVISREGVRIRDLDDGRAPSEDLSGYRVVEAGDLVVNKLWARFGAYGVAECHGIISPAYWVLRIAEDLIVPRYLHHLLQSAPFRGEIWRRSKDLPPNGFDLAWSQFRTIKVPLPPIDAQQETIHFLDRECARIAGLQAELRTQQQLLADELTSELDERISALDAPIRPLHTMVDPYRRIMYGIVLPGEPADEGVLLVKGGNVERNALRAVDLVCVSSDIESRYERSRVQAGDLLMTIRGSFGAVAQVPAEIAGANITQDTARIAPAVGVNARFLYHVLRTPSVQAQIERAATGAGVRGINIWALKRIMLPAPDLDMQGSLAVRFDRHERRAQEMGKAIAGLLATLDEYRDALINEAVTGKLDVFDLSGAERGDARDASRQGGQPKALAS